MGIGNYRKQSEENAEVDDEEIVIEDKRKDTEADKALKSSVDKLDASAQTDEEVEERILNYEERLQEAGITLSEAERIVDDVFTTGFYEEVVNISKKRTVKFRTRSYRNYDEFLRLTERESVRLQDTYTALLTECAMADSLVEIGGKAVVVDGKDEFETFAKKRAYVKGLNSALYVMVADKLREFDAKMQLVFSDGMADFI